MSQSPPVILGFFAFSGRIRRLSIPTVWPTNGDSVNGRSGYGDSPNANRSTAGSTDLGGPGLAGLLAGTSNGRWSPVTTREPYELNGKCNDSALT